jgi:hypothetical protein
MANLIQSPEHALPSMCESQARVYLDQVVPSLFGTPLSAAKLWTTVEDDRYYDVYQVSAPDGSRNERFYFDVTPYFERGTEWNYDAWLDTPDTKRTYPVWLFFGESELQYIAALGQSGSFPDLCSVAVSFREEASEGFGYRVASRDTKATRQIEVHATRSFASTAVPFLHGFPFYRLFIYHQLVHLAQRHPVETTEIGIEGSLAIPVPGEDCVLFAELTPFDLANDFLNFTFFTHEPHAFDMPAELSAFAETARFAVRSGLFTTRELRAALSAAHLDSELKVRLRSLIGVDAPRPKVESAEERVAH